MRVCRCWRRARWLRQSPGQLIASVRRGRNRLAPLREPNQAANSGARFRSAVRLAGGVGVAQHTSAMTDPFWGSKALAAGALTPYALRSRYVALHKDVYVPRDAQLTAELRAKALWLRSRGRGVLAGYSAAALHGAKWIGPDLPAAIIYTNSRRAPQIQTWEDRISPDEICVVDGMRVTTPERTALDLTSRYPIDAAVRRLTPSSRQLS